MTHQGINTALAQVAAVYAESILRSIQQEYPNQMQHMMTGPNDRPTPREAHPAFFGCFDWHSSVHMHWTLLRLWRRVPEAFDAARAVTVLDAHFTQPALEQEAAYLRTHPRFERPYGWGWALTLAYEVTLWEDAILGAEHRSYPARWSEALRPLADVVTDLFLAWLPKATYPVRVGMHSNSAFGLARAVPWSLHLAQQGDDRLWTAINQTATRWFANDRNYPAHYEPSGSDFLSSALTEVDLLSQTLERDQFLNWFDGFLPGLTSGEPQALFTPAVVSDASDGQLAHLHGLNLYRAFVWKRLQTLLPPDDIRQPFLAAGIAAHTQASLGAVTGSDYMVEHWLASFAMLYLSEEPLIKTDYILANPSLWDADDENPINKD